MPASIEASYIAMEAEKTKLLIAIESQKVAERTAETELKRATIEARKNAEVSAIKTEQELREMEGARSAAAIEDAMHLARSQARADAEAYLQRAQAETNALLLSPQFLTLRAIEALAASTRVFFGEKIPGTFVDVQGLLGGFNASAALARTGAARL